MARETGKRELNRTNRTYRSPAHCMRQGRKMRLLALREKQLPVVFQNFCCIYDFFHQRLLVERSQITINFPKQ